MFFPWNVVRMYVLRYFSSTSLAHLYNFAAICCLLKQINHSHLKLLLDVEVAQCCCQQGSLLLKEFYIWPGLVTQYAE